ncbi:MAG: aminotransferase class V-fold PLP-dependent enzyme, partial [Paracoccaceae bacterium]
GLMVPPGLGLVWANEKAIEAHRTADMRTPYWDWTARMAEGAHYLKYCGTSPVQHIYAMRTALDMIFEEGLENIWLRHEIFARSVRAAVEGWSTDNGITFNIPDPAHRSNSTTTVLTGGIDGEALRQLCEHQAGLTLGVGLGGFQGRAFRIGHMGHLNPPMVLGTLATVEAALSAMNAPMGGSGVARASEVIAQALAA